MEKSTIQFRPHRLLDARKRAFKTQEDVARALGVTTRAYQRWERGEGEPHPHRAVELGAVLGVDPISLYEDDKAAA